MNNNILYPSGDTFEHHRTLHMLISMLDKLDIIPYDYYEHDYAMNHNWADYIDRHGPLKAHVSFV